MIPEEPAEGILRTGDYGDSKLYQISCACGNEDDEIHLEVEADETGIIVHHYIKVKTPYWTAKDFISSLMYRFKITWQVWVKGYTEMHSYTILKEQQALNYAETIKKSIQDVKNFRESQQK